MMDGPFPSRDTFSGQMRVKGENMATRVCLVAILIGASAGQAGQMRPSTGQDILLSTTQALVGIDQLHVVLATPETGQEGLTDVWKLKVRVAEKLGEAGIKPAEGEMSLVPRLIIRIESAPVPDGDRYACRVQISLIRLMTLPSRPDLQIWAEVWQSRPVMEVVAKPNVAEAVSTAVLTQTEAFVAACKAAGGAPSLTPGIKQDVSAPPAVGQGQSSPRGSQAASQYPFVSSTSSQVFHRPDCRWAQNIASGNLVGYKSREEAVQAGKRPCKTCKP
jgi:hypothetical protein